MPEPAWTKTVSCVAASIAGVAPRPRGAAAARLGAGAPAERASSVRPARSRIPARWRSSPAVAPSPEAAATRSRRARAASKRPSDRSSSTARSSRATGPPSRSIPASIPASASWERPLPAASSSRARSSYQSGLGICPDCAAASIARVRPAAASTCRPSFERTRRARRVPGRVARPRGDVAIEGDDRFGEASLVVAQRAEAQIHRREVGVELSRPPVVCLGGGELAVEPPQLPASQIEGRIAEDARGFRG